MVEKSMGCVDMYRGIQKMDAADRENGASVNSGICCVCRTKQMPPVQTMWLFCRNAVLQRFSTYSFKISTTSSKVILEVLIARS